MKRTTSVIHKRWFFNRCRINCFRKWLESRSNRTRTTGRPKRELFAEALESRVLYSAAPVPVEVESPEAQLPLAETAQVAEMSQAGQTQQPESSTPEDLNSGTTLNFQSTEINGDLEIGNGATESSQETGDVVIGSFTTAPLETVTYHHPYTTTEIMVGVTGSNPLENLGGYMDSAQESLIDRGINLAESTTLFSYQGITILELEIEHDGTFQIPELLPELEALSFVEWASPNYIYDVDPRELIPNDPQFSNQYFHSLMGNTTAWDTTLGSPNIVVAIADDGVDWDHEDLAAGIWTNSAEIGGVAGVDDDGNGFIDDFRGWDFADNDNDPNPTASDNHGTHVAGIVGARINNSVGVAGTAPGVSLMPLRMYGGAAGYTSSVLAQTFAYATDNGAHILNLSYNINGFASDNTFAAGAQYMYDNGVLYFNSAGNGNQLNPARQVFGQALLVANTNSSDVRASTSNHGYGVDIAAPGSSIRSTFQGDTYASIGGTSMAAPNAAGVAALIWSANPTWTRDQVAAQLIATADNIDGLNPGYEGLLGSGRVNSDRGINELISAPQFEAVNGLPAHLSTVTTLSTTSWSVDVANVFDPASINNLANWELRGDGGDNIFGTADDNIITLSLDTNYMIGTNRIHFSIASPLSDDTYRFRAISGGLEDPFGNDLDGNGDGTGGDHFDHIFSVGGPSTEVIVSGGDITIRDIASAGKNDSLEINFDAPGNQLVITDPNAEMTLTGAGIQVNDHEVRVNLSNLSGNLIVETLLGIDTVTISGLPVLPGNLSVNAESIIIDTSLISSSGSQTYEGSVTLLNDLNLAASDVALQAVDSDAVTARSLAINTSGNGDTVLGGPLGSNYALSNLTTSADGETFLGGDVVTVGNSAIFQNSVTLTSHVSVSNSGTSGVVFNNTVDSLPGDTFSLNVIASGQGGVGFNDALGDTTSLHDLSITSAQADFTLDTNITASRDIIFDAPSITINSTVVSNGGSVNLTATGNVTVSSTGTVETQAGLSHTNILTQNFENFGQGSTIAGATVALTEGWQNEANGTADDIDWTSDLGSTTSGGTGPTNDHTLGTSAGTFLYVEASSPSFPSKTANLRSPSIDLSNITSTRLEFYYHMYGAAMGTLSVQGSTDGGATWSSNLFTVSGNQGNQWVEALVDLSGFDGEEDVLLRFSGLTGSNYTSDIAIDDVRVFGNTSSRSSGVSIMSTGGSISIAGDVTSDADVTVEAADDLTLTASATIVSTATTSSQGGGGATPSKVFASGSSSLFTIDKITGAVTTVGPFGGDRYITGLAYDPVNDVLYGIETNAGTNDSLVTINQSTGAATLVGLLGFNLSSSGLAFDQNTGTLYALNSQFLYSINTTTGSASIVGFTGVSGFDGLAYDPITNTMFGSNGSDDELYVINQTSGQATLIGNYGLGNVALTGLAFDTSDSNLYMWDLISRNLYTVNQTTAQATLVGPGGTSGVQGIAIASGSPPGGGSVILTANSAGPANGSGGSFSMGAGATLTTDGAPIEISSDEDTVLGVITSNSDVIVNSTSGQIRHTGALTAESFTFNGEVAPELMSLTGEVILGDNSILEVEIDGPQQVDYDRIISTGPVTIGSGVTLEFLTAGGYTPVFGDSFTVIENLSNDPVTGTFAGLGEGASIANFLGTGIEAQISYQGGTGNDVVIRIVNRPPTVNVVSGIGSAENGVATIIGTFTDPDISDGRTVRIDWGDPNDSRDSVFALSATTSLAVNDTFTSASGDGAVLTITSVDAVNGIVSFTSDHSYPDDGPSPGNGNPGDLATVTVSIEDGSLTDSGTTALTIANVAPSNLSFSVDKSEILEGESVSISGSFQDPGTLDAHTITVDWGDGTTPTTHQLAAGVLNFSGITHLYEDDSIPNSNVDELTITVSVVDDDENTAATAAQQISVKNIDPIINGLAITPSAVEGSLVSVTGTIVDPGTKDTFELTIDWDKVDGGEGAPEVYTLGNTNINTSEVTWNATARTFTINHRYDDDTQTGTSSDDYIVSVSLRDSDYSASGGTPEGWLQTGPDIDGEAAGDESGNSVSVSADGTTVAIGAYLNDGNGVSSGHVRIFDWNGTAWVQRGNDIDGENAGDNSGYSVSISADGNSVAVGATINSDSASIAGHVRIFDWNGTAWIQRGNDIDGESANDNSGHTVSMSDDGNTVAIGARYNSGNVYRSGHVRIFDWNGTAWIQRGADIDGENSNDQSGQSVALSASGNTVAIGARFNDDNGSNSGNVRIFDWNGNAWVKRGLSINGESVGDNSGHSVAISSNGNIVAIGAAFNDGNGSNSGHTRVFEWNGNAWIQRGIDLDGEAAGDNSGYSVALSADGNTLAVGATSNDGGGNSAGHVRSYYWDGNSWTRRGDDIDGEAPIDVSGYSVSLSDDGGTLAIGARYNDGNGTDSSHVRVFNSPSGNSVTYTADLNTTITNDAPSISLIQGPTTLIENDVKTISGTVSDAGTADIFSFTVNWGDPGSIDNTATFQLGASALTLATDGIDWNPATREFTIAHRYLDEISTNVALSVTDDDLGQDSTNLSIDVENATPLASAASIPTFTEGDTVNLAGLFTDSGTLDTHTFNWHLTSASNGQVIADSATQNFSFLAENDGTYQFHFTVTDNDGGVSDPFPVTVTVLNEAPQLSVNVSDSTAATLTETDSALSANGTISVSDPGINETVTAEVSSVTVTGGNDNGIPNATLLGMLSFSPSTLPGGALSNATANWIFDSGAEAFDYLDPGESLVLTYAVAARDDQEVSSPLNIEITINGTKEAPVLESFERFGPTTENTNADTLVFRVSFDEAVQNVDATDFSVTGTTASIISVTPVDGQTFDLTIAGGDLNSLTGTVGLNLAAAQNIEDLSGNALEAGEPAIDETYTVDSAAPLLNSVTRQAPLEATTGADSLVFRIAFSEAVTPPTASDFVVNGSTAQITQIQIVDSQTFDLTISGGDLSTLNGVVSLSLSPGQTVADLATNALLTTSPPVNENYTHIDTIPELDSIADQMMIHNEDTLIVALTASDADGDAISYTASLSQADPRAQAAYELGQQHQFYAFPGGDYFNSRGYNEKYFLGRDGGYFIIPSGEVFNWNGTIPTSTYLTALRPYYHADITRLFDIPAPADLSSISTSFSGDSLTIDPPAGFVGDFIVSVSASDGDSSDIKSFTVSVTNTAPTLAPVPDQTMSRGQSSHTVSLSASDSDTDPIAFAATVAAIDPLEAEAHQLDQTHDFSAFPGGDYFNSRGANEKYFQGTGGGYFILENGEVYQWAGSIAGSTLLGTLDASYHTDISKLFDVPTPVESPIPSVITSFSGNDLTIDPPSDFVGALKVTVTADDGIGTTEQVFTLTVTNSAPTLQPVSDQTMSHSEATLLVPLSVNDADGDELTFSATLSPASAVAVAAYELDQAHQFYAFPGGDYFNARGYNERYFLGNLGGYFIIPGGEIFKWNGTIETSTYITTLDPSFHSDITTLFNVPAPLNLDSVATSFSGSELTIDPPDGFIGEFLVTVSATDGEHTVEQTFTVSVTNSAPVIALINDQVMNQSEDTLVVPVTTSDDDGDSLSVTAIAIPIDPLAETAYLLDQDHNFSAFPGGDYFNARGANEKYFQGNSGGYFILEDGSVYLWNGSIAGSPRIGSFDASYYNDISKLFDVLPPLDLSQIALSFSGGNLTIDPPVGFLGDFYVHVAANDGLRETTRNFRVSVTA